jgi:hypothetical protein
MALENKQAARHFEQFAAFLNHSEQALIPIFTMMEWCCLPKNTHAEEEHVQITQKLSVLVGRFLRSISQDTLISKKVSCCVMFACVHQCVAHEILRRTESRS